MRPNMKQNQKTIALWVMIFVMAMVMGLVFFQEPQKDSKISFGELLTAITENGVLEITIQQDEYGGRFKDTYHDGQHFLAVGPMDSEQILKLLKKSDAKISYEKPKAAPFWQQVLMYLPVLLIVFFFFYVMRSMQAGGGKALSFGKTRA